MQEVMQSIFPVTCSLLGYSLGDIAVDHFFVTVGHNFGSVREKIVMVRDIVIAVRDIELW